MFPCCTTPHPQTQRLRRLSHARLLAMLSALCVALCACWVPLAWAKPAAVSPADQAREHAQLARAVYEKGQFSAAAELYRKAFRLDPSKPDYLYGVGKAEQKAGHHAQARAALEQLLALLPADEPLADRARKALSEVVAAQAAADAKAAQTNRGSSAPAAPEPADRGGAATPDKAAAAAKPEVQAGAAKPVPAQAKPADLPAAATPAGALQSAPLLVRGPAAPAVRWQTWTVAAVAVATGIGAGVLAGLAQRADSDADQYRVAGTRAFDPTRISEADAQAKLHEINNKWTGAAVCGGVAISAAVAATWMWFADNRPTRLAQARGLLLVGIAAVPSGPTTAQFSWQF